MNLVVVAGYFACAFFGILFGIFVCNKKPDGELKVDISDKEKDKYLMEFHIPLDEIPSRKKLVLKVVTVTNNS